MTTPDYAHFHKNRGNLALHIIVVPLFVAGVLGGLWCAAVGRWQAAVGFAALPIGSLVAQGLGHRREPNPPLPFAGPGNFIERILMEQFFRFPMFVLKGGWASAWRNARPRTPDA